MLDWVKGHGPLQADIMAPVLVDVNTAGMVTRLAGYCDLLSLAMCIRSRIRQPVLDHLYFRFGF